MNPEDVARGWNVAQHNGARPVDVVLSTVGAFFRSSF